MAFLTAGAAAFAAPSMAASPPAIGSVSAEVGENTVQLNARIRPDGLPTTYEFWLRYTSCASGEESPGCEPTVVEAVGRGSVPADHLEEAVSVALSSLHWSYAYAFWVKATNSDGSVESSASQLVTSAAPPPGSPGGAGVGPSYESKEEAWGVEGAEREAREAPKLEAERQREASERASKETAEREAKERESAAHEAAPQCVVPSLIGDTVAIARLRLRRAHCKLGMVIKPRHKRRSLVVVGEGRKTGAKYPDNTAVEVRLGSLRSRHRP